MVVESVEREVHDSPTAQTADAERERSTIVFPYGDLTDAVDIAKAVHGLGTSCQPEQLAAQLGAAPTSGSFRVKTSTAKIFGVTTYSQGMVQLTPLGVRICDPSHEKTAKAEAFLAVPLYKAIYEKFRNGTLPSQASALENVMVSLGVAKKQKERARQSFLRSAQQADFFWSGRERLVLPPAVGAGLEAVRNPADAAPPPDDKIKNKNKGTGSGDGGSHDPLLEGLINRLPKEGAEWSIEDRHRWFLLAAGIFEYVYKYQNSTGERRVLKIDLESAK